MDKQSEMLELICHVLLLAEFIENTDVRKSVRWLHTSQSAQMADYQQHSRQDTPVSGKTHLCNDSKI